MRILELQSNNAAVSLQTAFADGAENNLKQKKSRLHREVF